MSASVASNLKSLLNQSSANGSPADLSWRVLALVNLFRLLVVLLLFVLFMSVTPTTVGHTAPAVFIGTIVAYLLYTAVSISSVKRRWPDLSLQTFVNVCADVLAISFFTYSSGGMNSGLAALMILPIGAASFVVRQRLALLFAAMGTLALLLQQAFTSLNSHGDLGDFAGAGIVGALVFVVSLGIGPLARSLRESEERVRQREVDVANLAQLNQFIVQHLRESILVVDENNSIRLINESAAQLLRGANVERGTLLGEVSPRLFFLLEAWRRNAHDWNLSSLSLTSSDGGSMVQPHFVTLDRTGRGTTLIFLEDTTMIAERVQQSKLAALGRLSASIAHEIR